MSQRPLRVFSRPARPGVSMWQGWGWCWLCRVCKTTGWGFVTQSEALSRARSHCHRAVVR